MDQVGGKILTPDGFIEGYLTFDEGVVIEVNEGRSNRSSLKGIVIPSLINAHTHIADLRVPVDLNLSLEELVGPPNGLKHRMLNAMGREELDSIFREASEFMFRRGVSRFIDFRESGIFGSKTLMESELKGAEPVVMGRPRGLTYDEEEMNSLLDLVDGIGISSISDWRYEELEAVASITKSRGKMLALHSSERVREDIDRILDLEPDFLVHMTMANDHDIELCVDLDIPIVICPRSNLFFGRMPPISRMLGLGATLALGTDNAMISLPDILSEMELAGRLLRQQGSNDLFSVLEMAIANGRKVLKLNEPMGIRQGSPCDFMVVGPERGDAVTDTVLRSSTEPPLLVCKGDRVWREPGCAYSREC